MLHSRQTVDFIFILPWLFVLESKKKNSKNTENTDNKPFLSNYSISSKAKKKKKKKKKTNIKDSLVTPFNKRKPWQQLTVTYQMPFLVPSKHTFVFLVCKYKSYQKCCTSVSNKWQHISCTTHKLVLQSNFIMVWSYLYYCSEKSPWEMKFR